MTFNRLVYTAALLLAGITTCHRAVARQDMPPETVEDTVEAIDSAAEAADITGLAIAAIGDGEISWTHEYGVRSAVTSPNVSTGTIFEAAALGKPVLAYIVFKLVDNGKMELDRPLVEYAPYDDLSHDERYEQLTARTVLMHGTGLPTWRTPGMRLDFEFDPGVGFSYSGEAFVLLQHIVERVTLKPLDILARELVFDPLGMDSSGFVWNDKFEAHVAAGHTELGGALDKFVPEDPNVAYSLHTTATDYAKFLIAMATGTGLSSEMAEEAQLAQMGAGDGIYWGLGWGLQPTPEGMALWHWGDTSGFKSFAYITPEASKGLVYLTNSNNGMLILHEVFDRVISGEQTAVEWLQYERYDEPTFALGKKMIDAYVEGGIDSMLVRYEDARDELSSEAYEELSLNTLGYKFLRLGLADEAIAVFELNTRAYPEAYNTYDSLGEAYVVKGNLEAALENYRRAVELNPSHQSGKDMIALLERRLAATGDE